MGARPMARLIQDTIRKALAEELLFGRLVSGGKVTIDIGDDDKIKLVFDESRRLHRSLEKPDWCEQQEPAGSRLFCSSRARLNSTPKSATMRR